MSTTGKFVISLDFELQWGVRDKETLASYETNILGVQQALPRTLKLFDHYGVKATWATVGFLFAATKEELLGYLPNIKPKYEDPNLSPYTGHFDFVKNSEKEDKHHFSAALVELIKKYPDQEMATHTFSHYFCLEKGQELDDFRRDTEAAIAIAKSKQVTLQSLVFPKNQFNEAYLKVCEELGISSYRGNEKSWIYSAKNEEEQTLLKRAFRLLDTYINISGHHCASLATIAATYPYNIPSSRFLRPFSPKLKVLEGIRLRRILKSMTHAARTNTVFHLWWHPHNFGAHQNENFEFLEKILKHYQHLHANYGFENVTMATISTQIQQRHG